MSGKMSPGRKLPVKKTPRKLPPRKYAPRRATCFRGVSRIRITSVIDLLVTVISL